MLAIGCDKKNDGEIHTSSSTSGNTHQAGETKGANSPRDARRTQKATRVEKTEAEKALRSFVTDFENLAGQNKGRDTLVKQLDLALEVLPKLGGSDELLKFLNYLTERGAGDLRKELIEKHLGRV